MPRMIVCPCSDPNYCLVCCGSGTIPDRRSPTASDRAVERIKAMLSHPHAPQSNTGARVWDIIREEAGDE